MFIDNDLTAKIDQKEHAEKLHVSPFESAAATALDKGKHDFF